MFTATEPTPVVMPTPVRSSKAMVVIGWVLSVLPMLLFIFSAAMKFIGGPDLEKGMEHLGWPMSRALTLGVLELACVIVYLIPQTAVLGAILLTGYLGGAMATHLRIGESVVTHIIIGVVIWLGIFLRERRLWALIPFRRSM
jgi:hypothetical protein